MEKGSLKEKRMTEDRKREEGKGTTEGMEKQTQGRTEIERREGDEKAKTYQRRGG